MAAAEMITQSTATIMTMKEYMSIPRIAGTVFNLWVGATGHTPGQSTQEQVMFLGIEYKSSSQQWIRDALKGTTPPGRGELLFGNV
jgi:hypothetical protein